MRANKGNSRVGMSCSRKNRFYRLQRYFFQFCHQDRNIKGNLPNMAQTAKKAINKIPEVKALPCPVRNVKALAVDIKHYYIIIFSGIIQDLD